METTPLTQPLLSPSLNNKPPVETEEGGRSKVWLDFKGVAQLVSGSSPKTLEEIISGLNSIVEKINKEIEVAVKENLSSDLSIKVEIEFKKGSIEWIGIIAITDFLARIDGSVGGSKVIVDAIRFAINKIVRREIESNNGPTISSIETTVQVNRRRNENIHPVTLFLWWCCGANSGILAGLPTEKSKYQAIGLIVLLTGLFACFTGFYAAFSTFNSSSEIFFAVFIGLLWGLFIFNLDRFIISSLKKDIDTHKSFFKRKSIEVAIAIPRILLAGFIGYVIAFPFELLIFKERINEKIQFLRDSSSKLRYNSIEEKTPRLKKIDDRKNEIKKEINEKVEIEKECKRSLDEEMKGRGATGIYGYGPVSKQLEKNLANARKERINTETKYSKELESLENEKKELETDMFEEVKKFDKEKKGDLLEKVEALSALQKDSSSVNFAVFFISLMFFFVETAPIFSKLFLPIGPYDIQLGFKEKVISETSEHRASSVISDSKNRKDAIEHDSVERNDLIKIDSTSKKNSMYEIIQSHYGSLVDTERTFYAYFCQRASEIRKQKMDEMFQVFSADFSNSPDSNFRDLYKNMIARLSFRNLE